MAPPAPRPTCRLAARGVLATATARRATPCSIPSRSGRAFTSISAVRSKGRRSITPEHGARMNLYEYQAKELFARYGLPVLPGQVATTPEEARDIAASIGSRVVIKAQVQ